MTPEIAKTDVGAEVLIGIGRLEGRVEQFLAHQTRQDERLNNHGDRLNSLERGYSRILGWAAGVAAAVGAVGSALGLLLQNIKITFGG
ncbi:MAG: hypothetical protein A2882_01360 [Phenylobacterium sp. RIFCSPHIGHO2_01_FULL_70_10]|nr:MAG: hypothetical protein A2882_01360 [Phenylobacterium sp. RIFCSPHIGHO2_01_FULL_70_10]